MRGPVRLVWLRRESRSRAVAVLAALGILGSFVVALRLAVTPVALAASPVTQTFTPNGQTQRWWVPGGVTSVQITVRGGSGGSGFSGGSSAGAGGAGAQVTGTLKVSPGQYLVFAVGWQGSDGTKPGFWCWVNSDISQGGGGAGSQGVTNGGGDGGHGDLCGGGGGGGGGGDTWLLSNSGNTVAVDAAGGGGGGGGGGIAGYGGGDGGSAGTGDGNGGAGSGPGHGSGGAGHAFSQPFGASGGWAGNSSSAGGGGGGGAGASYHDGGNGGGGGGAGAGGGGGGGAGQSIVGGVVNDAKLTAGQAGTNGEVVISYTPSSKLGAAPPVKSAHRFSIAVKRCTRAAKRHCSRTLIPATFRYAIGTADRLTLIRRGYVYATGARRGKQLVLNAHRRVTAGRYTLVVAKRRAGHWYVLKHRIHIS